MLEIEVRLGIHKNKMVSGFGAKLSSRNRISRLKMERLEYDHVEKPAAIGQNRTTRISRHKRCL